VPNLVSPSLSLSAAASWGAADFSGGLATKRSNVFGVVVVAHGIGLLMMLALAVLAREHVPASTSLLWGLAAGSVGGAGLACLYKALAVGKMGLTAPLSAVISALVPIVFSFSTAGLPHGLQLFGFGLAIVSIWLIATQSGSAGESEGLGLAVAAGFGLGGFLLFIKFAGTQAVFWPLVAARAASFVLMCGILIGRRRAENSEMQSAKVSNSPQSWKPGPGTLRYVLLAGILDSGANALYVAATQRGRLDVAAVLSALYPASTVILARIFLKERWSRIQTAGMIAALVAVGMVSA
jgi:drug/metabolite transporter (DMT)-like permease